MQKIAREDFPTLKTWLINIGNNLGQSQTIVYAKEMFNKTHKTLEIVTNTEIVQK